jgi:hypothetical protein
VKILLWIALFVEIALFICAVLMVALPDRAWNRLLRRPAQGRHSDQETAQVTRRVRGPKNRLSGPTCQEADQPGRLTRSVRSPGGQGEGAKK